MALDQRSRTLGCFLGGAIGDALGGPIEFMSLAEIRRRFGPAGIESYVSEGSRRGIITDDTQMTLWTAEGLIRAHNRWASRGMVNAIGVVARAYLRRLHTQGEAPGASCLAGLRSSRLGTVDDPLNDSRGCVGVMRVAPIGLVAREPFKMAVDAAALTHGHPTGYLAAGAFARIVSELMNSSGLRPAIDTAVAELRGWRDHEETLAAIELALRVAAESDGAAEDVEALGGGWVAEEALAIALFCALRADDFRSGALLATNHSGDCDSTAAITGNLLGTMWGVEALPDDLVEGLELRELVTRVADDFADHLLLGGVPDYKRYPPV